MCDKPIRDDTAHIYCCAGTRRLVRGLKQGGETYDNLLRRMADAYDPDAERNNEGNNEAV